MRTLARAVVAHHWWAIVAWVAFIVGMQALSAAAGGAAYKDVFTLPGTESQQVLDLLHAHGRGGLGGQVGTVVVHARAATLDPAQAPPGLLPTVLGLCESPLKVASASSPWGGCTKLTAAARTTRTPGDGALSRDRRTALVTVSWQANESTVANLSGVRDRFAALANRNVEYEFTGNAFGNLQAQQQHGIPPEVFGFLAALLILAAVFRNVWATLLPLLCAGAALGSGLPIVALLSHAMNVATFATQLASLMVIGVGVDYALFIVTRYRRNLLRGMSVADSIALAVDTSGRAVLFAGATVCIAILGQCALGVAFLYGVAVGTSVTVGLTMVASLTLLPAVLSLLGDRVLPRKQRLAVRAGSYVDEHHTTWWARWARTVSHHKLVLGLLATGVMVVLALPFFALRLGHADQGTDPAGSTTRRGYDLIAAAPGFGPGYNSALELVVSGPAANAPATRTRAVEALRGVPGVDPRTIRPVPVASDLALIMFKSTSAPQDAATTELVKHLRADVTPELARATGTSVYVFGQTAVFVDFATVLAAKLPIFFAAVIGLSFLLLMIAFRSLVVPLTAALMNLFAAAASFGVVVAVFQWGWFASVLGIGSGGPIEAFLPVMFFAILFGLSMDYQVFLVSRMHEEWIHTHDNHRSVRLGQSETGGIITAAALIMIAVFTGFLLADSRAIELFGLGLAVAVFLDAFVLRTVLVPALMHVLGPANWWFPGWLDRLTPSVTVEPHQDGWTAEPDPEDEAAPKV
jgi:RND superfamily putative drug exporter